MTFLGGDPQTVSRSHPPSTPGRVVPRYVSSSRPKGETVRLENWSRHKEVTVPLTLVFPGEFGVRKVTDEVVRSL